MTPALNLAFFWHMHQPDYRDAGGIMSMPWVFLHGIKDYYEMPWLLSRYPGLKATFNITAPLIEQLNLYKEPLKNDRFLSLWILPPAELDEESRQWIVKMCRSTQFETMVRPLQRYEALYEHESYTDEEFLDLEVLFILAWCGNYLRQNSRVVKALLDKAQGYTQEDKTLLLDALIQFTAEILPFYASLQKQGVISIATTPYNHPILPLLIDIENAKRANAHTVLPDHPLSLEEDAKIQVERAIALYKETFGTVPNGFWPAEGAVDERTVAILRMHGLKWIATDEAILFKSLGSDDRSALYRPYRFDGVTIGFRDHGLSDLIGFTYRFRSGEDAAEHFMTSLKPIASTQPDGTVFVILDGENAWEFFENNAHDFFNSLYGRLETSRWCQTVSMDDVACQEHQPFLDHLAPGSWIHGNFDTWSGHQEKNRAWELIYQTRRDVDHARTKPTAEQEAAVRYHFLAAECSDWFWWYGDDHVTDFAFEFDALFRSHLLAIYRTLGMQPPSDLFEPIITHKSSESFLTFPSAPVSPEIDGRDSTFFEWLGCGIVDETKSYSTMDRVRGPIEKILYGHDGVNLYLAFEGDMASLLSQEYSLLIIIEEKDETLTLQIDNPAEKSDIALAIDERIELAIPQSYLDGFETLHLRFELCSGHEILQTMPGFGSLPIEPLEKYARCWFV